MIWTRKGRVIKSLGSPRQNCSLGKYPIRESRKGRDRAAMGMGLAIARGFEAPGAKWRRWAGRMSIFQSEGRVDSIVTPADALRQTLRSRWWRALARFGALHGLAM